MEADISEVRSFGAEVLIKRTGTWTGGKGALLDRHPRGERTEFNHRLRRHTLALHLEGTNARATLRYDGGSQVAAGCTLAQIMLIPAEPPWVDEFSSGDDA